MEQAYTNLVDREMSKWEALLELLRAEQNALQQGDISDLAVICNTKLDLVRNLHQLADEREKWKANNPKAPICMTTEKVLNKMRDSARTLNQQNGSLIDRRLHSVRRAVDVLLGSARKQNVYSQDGQLTSRNSYQPLSAA
jgi:flagellar biosynthesis/type III secretory pathway chaperone